MTNEKSWEYGKSERFADNFSTAAEEKRMGRLKGSDKILQGWSKLRGLANELEEAVQVTATAVQHGGTVFVCGNGGSSADAEHIVGELMKSFLLKRPATDKVKRRLREKFGIRGKYIGSGLQSGIRAMSLTWHPALTTAFSNDVDGKLAFAQQLYVLGKKGDVLIAISTSGNAENVLNACRVAWAMGIKRIGLTGAHGGQLKKLCEYCLCVPEYETYRIQELHVPLYHAFCARLEELIYDS